MKCRRPVFFGSLVVSMGGFVSFPSIRTSSKNKPERHSQLRREVGLSHLIMSVPCCHVAADEVVRTETAPPSPNRGHLAKEGSWVLRGSWGCFGVLQFRPERASGVWLLESKFSLSALRKLSAACLLQRYRNRFSGSKTAPPSPNRGHLAKEGPWVPWGSWGCFGVLRFRPERASGVWLRESNFRYLH